jgi:hypothetical protein
MRSCPTLNNNITTNNYKTELTMTEDAPNATDHDDDSKRIASSYNYDLPNQEQDDDDVFKWEEQDDTSNAIGDVFKWEDNTIKQDDYDMDDVSFESPIILNAIKELTRNIDGWEHDLPGHDNNDSFLIYDSFLPPGLLNLFERIENILDEWSIVMNEELMNEEEIKPIRNRVRRRREEYETMYYLKAIAFYTPPLKQQSSEAMALPNHVVSDRTPKAIKSKVGTSTQSKNTLLVVSYNLLSDRTPKEIKTTNVRDRDLNFDRDNPSLSPLSYNRALTQEDDVNEEACTMLFKKWKDKREADEAKVKQLRERVRRGYRVERRKRRKTESQRTTMVSSSELVTNYDANFDRDNPSLIPNVLVPSSELKLLSYKVLSHRTANNIKSPPSTERVINSDENISSHRTDNIPSVSYNLLSDRTPKAIQSKMEGINNSDINFNRDNPSSLLSNVLVPSSELKLISYNVSSDRTPNNTKARSLSSSNDTKLLLSTLTSKILSPSSNALSPPLIDPNANFDRDNPISSNNQPLSTQVANDNNIPLVSYNLLPDRTPKPTKLQQQSFNDTKVQPSSNKQIIQLPTASNASPLLNNNNNNNASTASLSSNVLSLSPELPSSQSIKPPSSTSIEKPPLTSSQLQTPHDLVRSSNQSPLSMNNNNNNNINNNNNKVSITIETPVTGRTTRKVNVVVGSKIPGTIHITKYDATLTPPNISITHEEARSKYAATEIHDTETPSIRSNISIAHEEVSTASPESSSTRSKISVTHEEASNVTAIPTRNVLKSSKLSSARPNISIAHESKYTGNIDKYSKTENQSSFTNKLRSKISIAHEETSTEIPIYEATENHDTKSWEFSSTRSNISIAHESKYTENDKTTRSKISIAHESKYTGMNIKYATTATEQSSYTHTPISKDNHIDNNKSFCSHYLQTVMEITNNNNNNHNDTFYNSMLLLLLRQIIPIHPFIEYLQPEPEPPPLNSYFILFLFLFIGKTKQVVLFSELLYYLNNMYSLSLTLIKNNNSETLSYINNIKTVLTHHVWSSSSFSAPLTDSKFLQIHINHTLLTHTKTNILLFIPEFRFCKCGEV